MHVLVLTVLGEKQILAIPPFSCWLFLSAFLSSTEPANSTRIAYSAQMYIYFPDLLKLLPVITVICQPP